VERDALRLQLTAAQAEIARFKAVQYRLVGSQATQPTNAEAMNDDDDEYANDVVLYGAASPEIKCDSDGVEAGNQQRVGGVC